MSKIRQGKCGLFLKTGEVKCVLFLRGLKKIRRSVRSFLPILMQFVSVYVAINLSKGEAIHTNGCWEGRTDFTYGSASN
jgi:hypothetical protein